MIRFLNLKNQILQGQNDFAFFDTVSDTILTFGEEQIFSSLKEFEQAYKSTYGSGHNTTRPLSRFTGLIPDGYFNS